MTNFEINKAFETEDPPFGEVRWTNEDIALAFESADFDYTDEDVAAILAECERDAFVDVMIEAGWQYIYNAIEAHMREKAATDRRAREEGIA